MTNLLIDLVLVLWMLLFGGMALLPIITGRRGHAAHDAEDRVISIAPARTMPTAPPSARMPLARDDHHDRHDHHNRPAA